ncbi:MAG: hypothetical protein ACR2NA_02510 [Solirubrobacterales bacterium]
MIYCVVPAPMADELYDKLVAYYADDPNVKVIVDRRSRSSGPGAEIDGDNDGERRRQRIPGTFPPIGPTE